MNNNLFPIFVKLEQMQLLIVGGGYVGLEKLEAVLRNSPLTNITLVSPEIKAEIVEIAEHHKVNLIYEKYDSKFLEGKDLVICGTNDKEVNKLVHFEAKSRRIFVNVADTPDLCDFYLSSVVIKGDLKIAISTNGKSPTFAKRFRALLEEILPDNIPEILNNLMSIRNKLKGDFQAKMDKLNEITQVMK